MQLRSPGDYAMHVMKHFQFNTDKNKVQSQSFPVSITLKPQDRLQVKWILLVKMSFFCNVLSSLLSLSEKLSGGTISEYEERALPGLLRPQANQASRTSDWLTRSSDHFCHWGHLSLSSNVVSLDVQQHCSWLYQKADRQTPSFRSVIQSTAKSITPANVPGKRNAEKEMLALKIIQLQG